MDSIEFQPTEIHYLVLKMHKKQSGMLYSKCVQLPPLVSAVSGATRNRRLDGNRRNQSCEGAIAPALCTDSAEKSGNRVTENTSLLPANGDAFGFADDNNSAHMARSYMLEDLQGVLTAVPNPAASNAAYRHAIIDENCLGKRSGQTRKLTVRHLIDLYALDPNVPMFHALRYFWDRDPDGQPLLALLCACARDGLLRASAPVVLDLPQGAPLPRAVMEEFLTTTFPNRFSPATLISVAQNLSGTWTQAGYLRGKAHKVRAQAAATPGATAYALYLGALLGARGQLLFDNPYAQLLDCPVAQRYDLAEMAARRNWLVLKRIGDVVEVNFPALVTALDAYATRRLLE